MAKRIFDILLCIWMTIWLIIPMIVFAYLIWRRDGAPIFYKAERMKTPTQSFTLWKFRTMHHSNENNGVSGGNKSNRVTEFGRWLRRTRMDELPQLWNIFKGDLSFVGPRPPLREYVEREPEIYAEVLKAKPGVSGLASLILHGYEERLLKNCTTPEETDRVYVQRCIPRKARMDILYRDNQSLCLDVWIVWRTTLLAFFKIPPRPKTRLAENAR